MPSYRIKIATIAIFCTLLMACNTPRNWIKQVYKNPEKSLAFYISLFVGCSETNKEVQEGKEVCCKIEENLVWKIFERTHTKSDYDCYPYPSTKIVDSAKVVQLLLEEMPLGGNTLFMKKYLSLIVDSSSTNPIMYSQHHYRRIDFAMYYYIYYDFFWQENSPFFHNIVLVGQENIWDNCYPKEKQPLLYGNPPKLYKSMETSDENTLLAQLHLCYDIWIKKVQKIGWAAAKKQKTSPFDNCPCHFRRILDDKPHFSRYPRTE